MSEILVVLTLLIGMHSVKIKHDQQTEGNLWEEHRRITEKYEELSEKYEFLLAKYTSLNEAKRYTYFNIEPEDYNGV